MSQVVDIRPGRHEVAAIHLPPGEIARVHHPDGRVRMLDPARVYQGADLPLKATVTGDCEAIGWGAVEVICYSLRQIRNGRHRLDRPIWDDAVKAIRKGGVAYVRHEQRDYFGRKRWTAVAVRTDD